MDGCSMGTDSYFAATLTGKILRKIAKAFSYREFVTKESVDVQQLLHNVIRQLFRELHDLKNGMQLEKHEMLNTLLIAIIDTNQRKGELLCVGDGLVCINGEFVEFEQNDKPDYLGYHLDEDFDAWYSNQNQKISATDISDISITTDGIFTFKRFNNKVYAEQENIIDFLLINSEDIKNEVMLHRKLIDIETTWGLRPTDDLAIIRLIFSTDSTI